jgi:hypothetical protein
MAMIGEHFMGQETQDNPRTACLARAISAELRRRYPNNTAGYVAQDLQCTKKAAANLLDFHLSATSIARIIAVYGAGWVADRVMEAAGTTLENFIEHQAAEAERAAVRARERAREARELGSKLQAVRRLDPGRDGAPAQRRR